MIAIIDHNVGNVRSAYNALQHIGCDVVLSRKAETIKDSAGIAPPRAKKFGELMVEIYQ